MAILDRFRSTPTQGREVDLLREEVRQQGNQLDYYQERYAELELQQEDVFWQRISSEYDNEFSRGGLDRIIRLSRLMTIKNPLINRAVNLQAMYVWGQHVSIGAENEDVDDVLQAFINDPKNQSELTSHQAQTMKEVELQTTGNVFFVFFTDASTGHTRIRSIPVEEMRDILTNPEDAKDPWLYHRRWQQRTGLANTATQGKEAYYPDWRYQPANRPPTIDGIEIRWDSPIYHVKVGGFADMRFGVPETYQALDWARAYNSFLEDCATLMRSLARFAWKMTVKGGANNVAGAKTKLSSTVGTGSGQFPETNPPPVTASTFISGGNVDMTPMPKTGASISPEDGRRLLLMVCAAMGMPESFFGDVSVGTLATAKSLDRPTELKFLDRQTLWADVLDDILQYVIDQSVGKPNGLLAAGTSTRNMAGDVVYELPVDPETGEPMDRHIDIDFPPILEHDVMANVTAIVEAATLNGHPAIAIDAKTTTRLLLNALGEDDVKDIVDEMYPEGDAPPAVESMVEAVRELREAVAAWQREQAA